MPWWDAVDVVAEADIVIVGSGSAGSSAAIAASRNGADVLLIDRLPFQGGTSTAVLDTFYGFYTPGDSARRVVDGIGADVIAGLMRLGPVVERPNMYGAGTGVTYNPEHLKVVWESLTRAAGARVLLHTSVQDVRCIDGVVSELLVATTAGLRRIKAKVIVDASGDADVCHYARFGYEQAGTKAPAQTLTTTFRMVNVDLVQRKTVTKDRLHAMMAEAVADGYGLPRREGSDHITPIDGVMATVMTRLDSTREDPDGALTTPTDPWFRTDVERDGREQALEYARFLVDRVPGYGASSLSTLSTQIGVRETRRVFGDYRLSRDDVLSARQFDDQIGLCGAPIEDHHSGQGTTWAYLPESTAVGIPLRTLIVRDAANVLVAGRCFSASHDAQASVRSMAQCIAMGQAAGVTAALASAAALAPRDVSPHDVREALRAGGAILELDR